MIIFFHIAYVIASSLMNIISSSVFNAHQIGLVNDDIQEEDHINEPVPEQDSGAIHVQDEVCLKMQQMNGKSSGQGLGLGHDEEQTTDDSSLRPRPYHIQGDGQDYFPALPYVSVNFENEDCDVDFRPIPPVYAQRYVAVKRVLLDEKWNGQIKKVIDFGCNDLAFFQYVKHMKGLEEVLLVDIDETLLQQSKCRVAPLNCDYLGSRENPLLVQVLGGSIAEQDSRLIGTDAVVCIELIEHLWPDEVEAVPYTVFGFVLPKVAIFTTPNADFNVVFKNFSGFRHPDHKFEWTREQFECWANNIVERYPAYEVTFHEIGAGPPGTEVYGCCSQMAVFVKRLTDNQEAEIQSGEVYNLICNYDYPYRVDSRTTDEKICQEAEYYIHRYSNDEIHSLEDGNIEIPLIILLPHVELWCNSIEALRKVLEGATWKISDRNPDIPAVVYPYYSAYSSSDEEDEDHNTSVLSEEKFTDEGYLQSNEDWDECAIGPSSKPGSSSEQSQLNGWNEIDCEGKTTMSLPIKVKQEMGNFKENSTLLHLDVGMTQNNEQSSFAQEIEGVTVFKPSSSACTINNAKHVSGEGHVKDASTGGQAEVGNSSTGLNSAFGETVQLGTLFQSNTVDSVSEGDSAIVMAGKPSCVRSMDDVALSTAANTVDFLTNSMQRTDSTNRIVYHDVMEDYFGSLSDESGVSTSMENNVSGSTDSLLPHDASDSSRSFFLSLLSRERRGAHPAGEQGMDVEPDEGGEEEEEEEDDDSSSGHSQDEGGGYRRVADNNRGVSPPRRAAQPHRNHLPFGLNAVENGDVANNNRDGEGNNAIAPDDEGDDEDDFPLQIDDEAGDHEDDEEEDDDDNANDVILLPDHADPFPPWLLHLLQVANEDGIELGAAGEPHIFLGDL